ncbi:hypothetical protein EW146_g9409, partial [Bondarzewia mesenterica]
MIYSRGSADDFDRYARATGDHGWSWDALQPYIKKHERVVLPADCYDIIGQIDISAHGTSGPLGVSLPGYPLGIDSLVMETTPQLPEEFPFNEDMNAGTPLVS